MVNVLPIEKRKQILHMLCEGSSMRATSRICDVSINTVTRLMLQAGRKADQIQYELLRNLPAKRVQVDEIWSFCYGKSRNVGSDKGGDIWTWTAIDADSRLMICWRVGTREMEHCRAFMVDLASRCRDRIQLTSDGLQSYVQGVQAGFGSNVHYGQLVKDYRDDQLNIRKDKIFGHPDEKYISTSLVERHNLSIRTGMKRYTRKTNAHSKKMENHKLAFALWCCFYNFMRIHQTLRVTPAMEAGIADTVWGWEKLLS